MTFLRRSVFVFLVLVPILAFAQADQQVVSAVDAPDPVIPGQTLTYTITMTNHGPNPAVNGGLNANLSGSVTYQNTIVPPGFSCFVAGSNVSCINPSWTPGTVQFTMTVLVADHLVSFPDGSFSSNFFTSGVTPDPNSGNNSISVTTNYNSPQMDLAIAVADSPDPVAPDGNITYTVDIINNGPDPATAVNFNSFNSGTLKFQSITIPAGWSCPSMPAVGGNPTFTCTKASVAGLETAQFIVVVKADSAVLGIADGSVSNVFGVNGTGDDTNDNNNQVIVTTGYVTPDADIVVTASDSPDPVFPDGDITYTVNVQNLGPDTAPNVTLNVPLNNTLRFQSISVPAGWSCSPPAVGAGTSFSCSIASLPVQPASTFTIVLRANDEQFGIADGTIDQFFGANSSIVDPNNSNNGVTVSTSYVTPDADIIVTASDSPDPVAPDGDITYTVNVQNAGPNTAPNVTLNVPLNNTLRFQSISVPAGWNCSPPAVGAGTSFSCTIASLPVQPASTFTIVLRANDEQFGINDGTIHQVFGANSTIFDPNNANNNIDVATSYSAPDANLIISASDSPDPVVNGNNVTFSITVNNSGADAAPNAQMVAAPDPSLTFQSVSAPAGWSCTTPAVNVSGVVTCTNPSMPNGAEANFTVVTKLVISGSGGTLTSNFSTSSNVQDPVPGNNIAQVLTSWIGQTSDLTISKNTLSTAAAQGSTITYTISTANNGPDNASNVTVTDVLPAQLLFQSITPAAGWNCTTPAAGTNGTVTCTIAVFPNGGTAQFTLVTTVAPNATGSITNSAGIGSSVATDPSPGNASGSTGAVAIAGNADLGTTKTTNATSAPPNGTISYTITVSNAGPDPAASVVMTDVLPASLLFQSIITPGAQWSCTTPAVGTNGTVTCNAATLASNASAVFTLNATVAANATGTITNSASAAHSGTDGNAGNSGGSTGAIPVGNGTADLVASKTTTATSVPPGGTFSYTIGITNNGPDAAPNVVVTDTLPASLLFQSITPAAGFNCVTPAVGASGTITCTAATLANGATATFTLTVQVAANATGTLVNNVVAASDAADGNPGNSGVASAPVPVGPASADLSISKTTASTNVSVGTVFNYTITVSNAGPSTATGVTVNDTLPAGLEFVSATPSQGSCNAASPLSCNLGTIAAGNSATIALQVRAAAVGNVTNSASVVSVEDPAAGNNSDDAPEIIIVGGPAEGAGIPTLSEWALIALMAMLALVAAVRMRT